MQGLCFLPYKGFGENIKLPLMSIKTEIMVARVETEIMFAQNVTLKRKALSDVG